MFDKYKKHESQSNIIHIPRWNSTPSCIDHNHYKRLIRSQVRPYSAPSASNYRKVIDFASAQLSEDDKRFHCLCMFETLEKIAICYNVVNYITEDALYWLYEAHEWQCVDTGTHHIPFKTELTIAFKLSIQRGGKLSISNCKPVYRQGWHGGFYRLAGKPAQQEMIA